MEAENPFLICHENSYEYLETLESIIDERERKQYILGFISNLDSSDTSTLPIVPEFEKELQWYNVQEPLRFGKHLRKKLVVLDFFTYCCINCLHILPDLQQLERNFTPEKDGLVVVGVHSAKFDNEKVSANILSAVLRYDIAHPVVNDSAATLWHQMAINCWPTLVVLGPGGRALLVLSGEGHKELLFEFISAALEYYNIQGGIVPGSVGIVPEKTKLPPSPLLFPGKISVDPSGDRLAVSDTAHHRILITSVHGVVETSVGSASGESGRRDGSFTEARFSSPQGLCWLGDDSLFVADVENHAIRKVDLRLQRVTTVAGSGLKGTDADGGASGSQQAINSPWDVLIGPSPGGDEDSVLYVAMAGAHQIWAVFLEDISWWKGRSYTAGTCVRLAGSGLEENRNNNYPDKAGFAQPSGLALGQLAVEEQSLTHLFVADSESSSVRSLRLLDGAVKAVAGGDIDPTNLFAFGDTDGQGNKARLQHPLAVTMNTTGGGPLFVADSYNHKIKAVDLSTRVCRTILGSGRAGSRTGSVAMETELNEPGGLSLHPDGRLFIADTNNHSIKVFDLSAGSLSEVPVLFGKPALENEVDGPRETSGMKVNVIKRLAKRNATVIQLDPHHLLQGTKLNVQLALELSPGNKLTTDAPSAYAVHGEEDFAGSLAIDAPLSGSLRDLENQPRFTVTPSSDELDSVCDPNDAQRSLSTKMEVECIVYYCDSAGACRMKALLFTLPLLLSPTSSDHEGDTAREEQCRLEFTL